MKRIETRLFAKITKAVFIWFAFVFAPLATWAFATQRTEIGMLALLSGFVFAVCMIFVLKRKISRFACPDCDARLVEDWSQSDALERKLSLRCDKCEKLYETDFRT